MNMLQVSKMFSDRRGTQLTSNHDHTTPHSYYFCENADPPFSHGQEAASLFSLKEGCHFCRKVPKKQHFLELFCLNSNPPFSANFCPIDSRENALESPCIILCIFATYEHLRALYEQARALLYGKSKNLIKNPIFISITYMPRDAREMLADARKVQKYKV